MKDLQKGSTTVAKRGRSKRPGRPQGANPKEQQPGDVTVSNDASAERIDALIESQEQQDKAEAEAAAAKAEAETAIQASTPQKVSRATADCESAKETACSCRCRGKYHGQPHPDGWKLEEGCEPLNEGERKAAKKAALYSWRKAHPERVSAYMKQWREEKTKKEEAAKQIAEHQSAEEAGE